MFPRIGLMVLGGSLGLLPISAVPAEMAVASVARIALSAPAPSECVSKHVIGDLFRRPLRVVRAIRGQRPAKVLAIGSSSTAGVGASSPSATYVARLEPTLEGALKGTDFDVVGRGRAGEVAQGAADRMKKEVEDIKPDLIVWQVGTNDALRHVSIDAFKNCLKKTLAWVADNKIDVVLVNPQYGDTLTKDQYYEEVVKTISEVARDSGVVLVDRFAAMRELQKEHADTIYLSTDNLHMNDVGHRCMAEQLAQAIVGGLIEADADQVQSVF
jgi:acyl-CoA thioesterase-1